MSDSKTRIRYSLEEGYNGKYSVSVYTKHEVDTVEEGFNMIKSMYVLEDPADIDPSIEIRGVPGLDIVFNLEK
jgi:hypothetical protein